MIPSSINRKSKDILRALMDPACPDVVAWSSGELRAILEHQLGTPLKAEHDRFVELSQYSRAQVKLLFKRSGCTTFRDLIMADKPCVDALRLVKDFVKTSLTTGGDLPRDVARVLYIMTILQALSFGDKHFTALDGTSIEGEARRCLTFGWLPNDIMEFIRDKIKSVRSGDYDL